MVGWSGNDIRLTGAPAPGLGRIRSDVDSTHAFRPSAAYAPHIHYDGHMSKRYGQFLIVLAILVSLFFVFIAANRDLSALENTLLQVFSLGIGLIGSYILGQELTLNFQVQHL
jgi:uncharacterized integral membrane protein